MKTPVLAVAESPQRLDVFEARSNTLGEAMVQEGRIKGGPRDHSQKE